MFYCHRRRASRWTAPRQRLRVSGRPVTAPSPGPFGAQFALARGPAWGPHPPDLRRGAPSRVPLRRDRRARHRPSARHASRRRADRGALHGRGLSGRRQRPRSPPGPLRDAGSAVVVAEAGSEVLGFIALHVVPRFEHDDSFVRILALVVDPGRPRARRRSNPDGGGGAARRARSAQRSPRSLPATIAPTLAGSSSRWGMTPRSPPTSASGSDGRPAAAGGRAPSRPRALTAPARPRAAVGAPGPFPRLRLRDPSGPLLDLPWEQPLEAWDRDAIGFRAIPIGPSRHLVRFLDRGGVTYALKELALDLARARVRRPAAPRVPRVCRPSRPSASRRRRSAARPSS